MALKNDYNELTVQAAQRVMLEIINILGEYRDGIFLVGGWVPRFLGLQEKNEHVGSMDVDIAFDHKVLAEVGYETICNKLEKQGYRQSEEQPFIFYRDLQIDGRDVEVAVDLLAGEYEGSGRSHRTQSIQDVRARKARGCDLVFEMSQEVRIHGYDANGYRDSTTVKIPSVVPFLVMKSIALGERRKEKDPYDIYFVLTHFPDGLDSLVDHFRPYLDHGLVKEGLSILRDKFASPDHTGPNMVADFEIQEGEDREMLKRDVYEHVQYLLQQLDFVEQEDVEK